MSTLAPSRHRVQGLSLALGRTSAGAWERRSARFDGDVFETPERTLVVLGLIREPGGGALGAERLVRRGVVHQDGIRADRITGCGLVVCMEHRRPVVRVYRTLLGLPHLYFHASGDALHVHTSLPDLLSSAGPFEPDEAAAADHFTLRYVLPPRTYYRGVGQLPGGHLMTWEDGALAHRQVTVVAPSRETITAITPDSVEWLDGVMRRVVTAHADAARRQGRTPVTLLSGGVDSVLVQLWLGADRSGGFAVPEAESFRGETRRAIGAADALGTEHLVAPITAAGYSDLLDRVIHTLARPSLLNEAWPGHLALAERLRERWGADLTVFGGNAADGLHGAPELGMVVRQRRWSRVPGMLPTLRAAAPLLRRLGEKGENLATTALLEGDDHPLRAPSSLVALAGELPLLLECFGEDAVRGVFDRRRALARAGAPGDHSWERLQGVALLATGSEPSAAVADMHGSAGLGVAMVNRDDEVISALAAFHPDVRFRGDAGDGRIRLKPLQTALTDLHGHGHLARVPKGGTTFWKELWQWMGSGILRDRVMAIERAAFVPAPLFERVRRQPSDFLWNLLIHDAWRRSLRSRGEGT